MKRFLLLSLTLGLFSLSTAAEATILHQRTISINRSVNIFDTDEFDLDLTLGDSFFNPSNPLTLFDDVTITPADVGTIFELQPGDTNFAELASRWTDGQNEFVRLIATENQANGLSEQRGFFENMYFLGVSTPVVPDLSGEVIERVTISLDNFNLVPNTGSNPASSLSGPPVDILLTVTVFGAVPEPTGIWLLASGLVTLWIRRR